MFILFINFEIRAEICDSTSNQNLHSFLHDVGLPSEVCRRREDANAATNWHEGQEGTGKSGDTILSHSKV